MTRTLHRALITGLGAVTPIGNDVESYWDGLQSGRNGIDRVAEFDPTDLIVRSLARLKASISPPTSTARWRAAPAVSRNSQPPPRCRR